jgi:hypothetical protein
MTLLRSVYIHTVLEMEIQKCWYISSKRNKDIPLEKWKMINVYEYNGKCRYKNSNKVHRHITALFEHYIYIYIGKSRRMRWAGHVARMGAERKVYKVLVGNPEGTRPLGRPNRR